MLGPRSSAAALVAAGLFVIAIGCGSSNRRGGDDGGAPRDAASPDTDAPDTGPGGDAGPGDGGGDAGPATDGGAGRDAGGDAAGGDAAGGCADADGDGFEDEACGGADCADDDPAVHPGATETCNEVDDDCDGDVDEGLLTSYWPDADGDGFGDASADPVMACSVPDGHVDNDVDCNDEYDGAHPGATEVCNYIDDNCDTNVDEGTDRVVYYEDADGDGHGGSTTVMGCAGWPPPGGSYTTTSTDCYDGNADAHPGQESFFTSDRGDSLYDYNCDGLHESFRPISPGCTSTADCESGWNGSPPACGTSGSYLDCHVSGSSCVKYNRNYRNACR